MQKTQLNDMNDDSKMMTQCCPNPHVLATE